MSFDIYTLYIYTYILMSDKTIIELPGIFLHQGVINYSQKAKTLKDHKKTCDSAY